MTELKNSQQTCEEQGSSDTKSQLRILHVVEATFAGVGRHVLDLVEAQLGAAYEVHVAFASERISRTFLSAMRSMPDAQWHECNMKREVGLHDMSAVTKLRHIILNASPDIVHGHSVKGGALARLASIGCNCHVFYTPNGISSLNPDSNWLSTCFSNTVERILAIKTDRIIAASKEEFEHIKRMGIAAHKTSMINNGIRPIDTFDRDNVRLEFGIPSDVNVVGFVGRLVAQKAPFDLIRIFAEIAKQESTARFVVIGFGPLEAAVKDFAKEFHQLKDRLYLLGEQPSVRMMAAFDVFLLPSLYEGFPLVLLEAAASGLPIVTTTGACASDIVHDAQSGFICQCGDIEAMAERTMLLLHDPSMRTQFAESARRLGQRFTVEKMASEVEDLISICCPH